MKARAGAHRQRKTGRTRGLCAAALAAVGVSLLGTASASAAPFTDGNMVIYRVGSGTGALVNTGSPVFLDEYTPAGTLVQSIPLPTTASGTNRQLIASGTATSEGLLTRSVDGRFITLTGYARDLGGTGTISSTTSATVPRVIGRLDATGSVDTSTALTDFASGNNPRSAVSTDGTNLWATGGTGGVRYATLGSTTSTQLNTAPTNLRQVNIFDGQLYVSSASGTTRVATVGTGTPTTTGQTITNVPGTPSTLPSPYAFQFLDLTPSVPGVDTLYVADDGAGALSKYSLVGGSYVSNGTVGVAADAYRGLTARVSGSNVTLFATRKGGSAAAGGGELVSLVDSTGYNGAFAGTPTLLATATTNTAFRGVALSPVAAVTPLACGDPGTITDANDAIPGNDIVEGTSGNDLLCSDDGPEVLRGEGGNDTLFGQGGNDVLDGGTGADSLSGGDGVDRVSYSGRATDLTVTIGAGTANDGAAGEGDDVRGDVEDVRGGAGNDSLTGDGDPNLLLGEGGDDDLFGEGGADDLRGDSSNAQAGNDEVRGGSGNDALRGYDGADQHFGEAGNDTVYSDAGADVMSGGDGIDSAFYAGRTGSVFVSIGTGGANDGGLGEGDEVQGDFEKVSGGSGDDTLFGNTNPLGNVLLGGAGNDTLEGGGGPKDLLVGDAGTDSLNTNDGDSDDTLSCGAGTDTFNADPGDRVNADCP